MKESVKLLSVLNKAKNISITYGFPVQELSVLEIDVELDARGLACPMPLLKLKQSLNKMESGQVIRVYTTDSGSLRDFAAFLRQVSSQLLEQTENDSGEYCFLIKK